MKQQCGYPKTLMALAVAGLSSSAVPVVADELSALSIEEVVVTAQRRAESVEDIPMAVNAFDSSTLESASVDSVGDLAAMAPGFGGDEVSSATPYFNIRGIGSYDFTVGNDPALGIYVDDVYVGRFAGAVVNLDDIERVEVLKGPQGTLFGRNTTAGAINITRNQPSEETEGRLRVGVGTDDLWEVFGVYNTPLVEDKLLFRGSYYVKNQDGLIEDQTSGDDISDVDTESARLAFTYLGEEFDYTTSFEYQKDRHTSPVSIPASRINVAGQQLDTDEGSIDPGLADEVKAHRDIYAFSGVGNFNLSDDYTLKSITSYRKYEADYLDDSDGEPINLLALGIEEINESYSQEFRLSFDNEGDLVWFVGVSAFKENVDAKTSARYNEDALCFAQGLTLGQTVQSCDGLGAALVGAGAIPGNPFAGYTGNVIHDRNKADGTFESYAVYGDFTYALSDSTNLTVGARYSYDKKEVELQGLETTDSVVWQTLTANLPALGGVAQTNLYLANTAGEVKDDADWESVTGRIAIDHTLDNDWLIYGSISQGYKAGGFNILVPEAGEFDPEEVLSFEVGLKGSLMDRRVIFDVVGYYYEYDDLQVQIIDTLATTQNAASSTGYGLETSVQAVVTEQLRTIFGMSLASSEYDEFSPEDGVDYGDNDLPRSPNMTANLILDYGIDRDEGSYNLRSEISYTGRLYLNESNAEASRQGGYTTYNLSVEYVTPSEEHSISLYANNVTDKEYRVHYTNLAALGIELNQWAPRRTMGVRWNYSF